MTSEASNVVQLREPGQVVSRPLVTKDDRAWPYLDWRRDLGLVGVVIDIDAIEWRNGQPVAVIEITQIQPHITGQQSIATTLAAIKDRLENKTAQATCYRRVGNALAVSTYCVAFQPDAKGKLERIWIYSMTDRTEWSGPHSPDQYARWLAKLR